LTLTDAAIEGTHNLVVQAYVQTHGHTLAHAVIQLTFYTCRCPPRADR
jgi:hypothetical protein